jgi:ABC-2 type transport system permease protein
MSRHWPLLELTRVRLLQYIREPEVIFWTFGFPLLLAVGLGIAFSARGGETVPVAVLEGAGAAELAASLAGAPGLTVEVLPGAAAQDAQRRGRVAIVVVPGDSVAYQYDPTRPESRTARVIVDDALQRAAGRADPQATVDVPVEERGARYIDFLIPGLIGLNLLGTGLWGVGFALVKMRTDKLLKRFIATPMRRSDFLLSFVFGRLAFLPAELVPLLLLGWLLFGVDVQGSVLVVGLLGVLGALTFAGLGLLVASRTRTQESVMGLMNLVQLPMWILSGVFFSAERFPAVLQPAIQALPLTALLNGLRAVMNEGATLTAVTGPIAILVAWGVVSFGLALAWFRWR